MTHLPVINRSRLLVSFLVVFENASIMKSETLHRKRQQFSHLFRIFKSFMNYKIVSFDDCIVSMHETFKRINFYKKERKTNPFTENKTAL